ncbi:sensor histidine kinase [Lentibacillus saliphilus]|uniref:sensor histidine kinase n=1 Tax=Lentibacillus saliphilus TaxID=2737028 RepID=UPI001C3111A4|nr:sensor histidine kinase [Lentibacillus saliphilus]
MRPTFRKSLQQRIFVFTLLIVFVPLTVVGIMSYVTSTNMITDKLKQAHMNVVDQIGGNIAFVLEDIHDLSLFFIQSEQARDLLDASDSDNTDPFNEKKQRVEQLLLHLIGSKDYIASIQIENPQGDVLINTGSKEDPLQSHTKRKLNDLNGSALITTKQNVISYSRLIKNVYDVTEPLGYMTIKLKPSYIYNLFENNNTKETASYFLINSERQIVVKHDENQFSPAQLQSVFDSIANVKSGTSETSVDGNDYIRTFHRIKKTPLTIVHVASLDALMQENQFIPSLILIALIVSLLIYTIVAYQFSKYIVRPINHLQTLMKRVEDGNLAVRFEPKGQNEIAMLGRGFNTMLEKLTFLIEMVYLAQIKNKEAELKALHAQINPHFLYNTLNTIYWMGQMEQAPKSAKMTHALSKLFQLMLKDQKDVTSINNEIEYVSHYLDIQKVRYEDMIAFNVYIEPETRHAKTVKMILQPLIENAITHGIEPKEDGGTIFVSITRRDNLLLISVEDDGVGADLEALNQMLVKPSDDYKGLALKNIYDRIKIQSGEMGDMLFAPTETGGLKVCILQKWEEDRE